MNNNITYQSIEEYAEKNPDIWKFLYGDVVVGDYRTVDELFNRGEPVHKDKY